MNKSSTAGFDLSEAVSGWTKVSEHLYEHVSGTRIERRGYPEQHGWYLISPVPQEPIQRFKPNPEGCDAAFVAFASQRAVSSYLSSILGRAS